MSDPDAPNARTRTPGSRDLSRASLMVCVEAAIAAPSVLNSQPWRFRIRGGGIDVFADWNRQLQGIDPSGRELLISIGAAVFNVRVAMRQQARAPLLWWWPEPAEPDLVARVVPGQPASPGGGLSTFAEAIPRRHTNRRPFAPVLVPGSVLDDLAGAARLEGATLRVADPVSRAAILTLVHTADERLRAQGIYRAERTEWMPASRHRRDGMPPQAFGPWDAMEALPMRDFGLTRPQLRRRDEQFEPYPTLVLLSTNGDTADDWLRAGQALQRVLLAATMHGLAATPMSQPLEIPALRELVTDTAAGQWAQVILRLGYGQPTTASPRRPLTEVLVA